MLVLASLVIMMMVAVQNVVNAITNASHVKIKLTIVMFVLTEEFQSQIVHAQLVGTMKEKILYVKNAHISVIHVQMQRPVLFVRKIEFNQIAIVMLRIAFMK